VEKDNRNYNWGRSLQHKSRAGSSVKQKFPYFMIHKLLTGGTEERKVNLQHTSVFTESGICESSSDAPVRANYDNELAAGDDQIDG
jgi:hypothetical protein